MMETPVAITAPQSESFAPKQFQVRPDAAKAIDARLGTSQNPEVTGKFCL